MSISLSPLQLIAESALGSNFGVAVNTDLTLSISNYTGTALISPLSNAIANSAAANVSSATLQSLSLIASNSCPALGDSPPSAYLSDLGNVLSQYANVVPPDPALANVPFTNTVVTVANAYLGNGQLSIFAQIFQSALSFVNQNNDYLNAVDTVQSTVAPTFTSYNDLITGDLGRVNLDTVKFGQDLERTGFVLNLANLENLGSPAALLRQIIVYLGLPTVLQQALFASGIGSQTINNLVNPNFEITDSLNRLIYQALASINEQTQPEALGQVLTALRVTTEKIRSLADLLNPTKLFPNSFTTLTVPTTAGSKRIYTNASGSVDSNLVTLLPTYVINTVSDV